MLGTIISLILGTIFFFYLPNENLANPLLTTTTIALPILFLLLFGISKALALNPLQRIEQNLTPRLLQLFRKDRHIKWTGAWMLGFLIFSSALAVTNFSFGGINPSVMMFTWTLLLGITFDLYFHFTGRLFDYLNPFSIVELFTKGGKESIQEEHEIDLCDWVDALSEVSLKSLNHNSTSLCNTAIDQLSTLSKHFLESEKSISHHKEDSQTEALGITDKVSYTLFFILQRFELIMQRSTEKKIEPVCSHVITAMGKVAVYSAKLDMTLPSFALEQIGKFSLNAQKHRISDVGVKATYTLLEVAREIVNEVDIKYCDLKHPFMTLNTQMEEITKELFRQNKTINFSILVQPFVEMKKILQSEKMSNHQDQAVIIKDIDRILDEFGHLQAVMQTAPPQEVASSTK